MIDLEALERIAQAALYPSPGMTAFEAAVEFDRTFPPATVIEILAEVRRLRNLLDNRPAVNAALLAEFMKWTAVVYDSDIAAARAAHPKEGV